VDAPDEIAIAQDAPAAKVISLVKVALSDLQRYGLLAFRLAPAVGVRPK
jgi:hypothetical protein